MVISLRLQEDDANLIRTYAAINGITLSEFARRAMLRQIEDEYDLSAAKEAFAEYRRNPVTYTHEEVSEMLGID